MINYIKNNIINRIKFYKSIVYLRLKRFNIVDNIAIQIINNKTNSYYGYYILALSNYYQCDIRKSMDYFIKMIQIKKINQFEILNFFISKVLGTFQLNNNYDEIIYYGEAIKPFLHNQKARIVLLKFISYSYKKIDKYENALLIINELEEINPNIRGLKERKEYLIKEINKNNHPAQAG